jgi:hypothetical protein
MYHPLDSAVFSTIRYIPTLYTFYIHINKEDAKIEIYTNNLTNLEDLYLIDYSHLKIQIPHPIH